jgi:hypothetical protein
MTMMKIPLLLLVMTLCSGAHALGQQPGKAEDPEAAYTRVVNERADKIVASLGIDDPAKARRVRDLIAQQYRNLRAIHDPRDEQIKRARETHKDHKEAADAAIKAAQDQAKVRLDKLHGDYLAKLAAELSPEQIVKVKDGMTYGVVDVTYNAYLKMFPDLTEAQKAQIRNWLTEAREIAMDGSTSNEKHAVFGKYKGRINNYLSAAGYNLKKGEENLRR